MARANQTVANLLNDYADLLSITGGEAFKARTYEKAARAIAGHPTDITGLTLKELQQIPGVGKSIAEKVLEYFESGEIAAVEKLRLKVPEGVRLMTAVPGLGPKKAMVLYEELGISTIEALEEAIAEGRLSELRGFGAKTAENILHGIGVARGHSGRVLIDVATAVAEEIVGSLSALKQVHGCTYAGSLRRMRETIGDVDILAASSEPTPIMEAFVRLPLVAEVILRGDKKTSVRTTAGLQVDLRVVPVESFGAAIQYFTGSKAHNVRLREIAIKQGYKLSEYGLFRVDDGSVVAAEDEEDIYLHLGLPWIPPTLREDTGEFDHPIPELVTIEDIRGDLHTHTTLTDGISTLDEMVEAGKQRGLKYYAVTDHAPDLPMQRMTDKKMLTQREAVRALTPYKRMSLLHGTELNIGPEGDVDWDADFLAGFDIRVASIHSHFNQTPDELTRRLIRACENPYVNIIGHPTTRKIGRRAPIAPDWDAVFATAARTNTAMEINSHPDRLDLPDDLIRRARRHGVVFAINTDSHSTRHLAHLRFGIGLAQRGWLTADDVINTWPLTKLRAWLKP
jgi:DNA polymerase (family 10)